MHRPLNEATPCLCEAVDVTRRKRSFLFQLKWLWLWVREYAGTRNNHFFNSWLWLVSEFDPTQHQGLGRDGLSLKRHRRLAPGHLAAPRPLVLCATLMRRKRPIFAALVPANLRKTPSMSPFQLWVESKFFCCWAIQEYRVIMILFAFH